MSKIKRVRIVLQDKLLNLAKQCGSVLFMIVQIQIQVRFHLIVSVKSTFQNKTLRKLTGFLLDMKRRINQVSIRQIPSRYQTKPQQALNLSAMHQNL